MDRRHYLALLIGVGTAGCNTDELPVPSEETPTPTGESTDTPTQTPTDTPDETDTPEETDEPLSQEELEASKDIESADSALGDGLDTYAALANAESILDVRASVGEFDISDITAKVEKARQHLDDASENANETQKERIQRLRGVTTFLRRAVRTQQALGRAYERLVAIHEGYLDEDFTRVNDNRSQFRTRIDDADKEFGRLSENTSADDTAESDHIDRSTYEQKRDQLDSTITAFRRLGDDITQFTDRMRYWRDGVDKYLSERWTPAAEDLADAQPLGDVADRIEADPLGDDPTDSRLEDLREIASTLGAAAVDLEASANAYRVRDRQKGKTKLEDTQTILDESAVVRRNIESAEDILDYDGP